LGFGVRNDKEDVSELMRAAQTAEEAQVYIEIIFKF
jgi:peptidoglycan hydrolase CwlO-like protein